MLLFELDFEEVSKKKLRECWSQLCRIRCNGGNQKRRINWFEYSQGPLELEMGCYDTYGGVTISATYGPWPNILKKRYLPYLGQYTARIWGMAF